MEGEIVRADKGAAKRLWLLIALAVVLGSVYFGYLFTEIERASADPEQGMATLMQQLHWMSIGFLGVSLALGGYLVSTAVRVLRSGRFPLPGARVVRDTRVRRGGAARWMAVSSLLLAVILVLLAFIVFLALGSYIDLYIDLAPTP